MARLARALAVLCALFATTGFAHAADIHLLASNAVKQAWLQLAPKFEKLSGDKVVVEWGGTADIARRIGNDEQQDVVIAPAATIDDLIRQGKLAPGSRADIAASPIGVAVRRSATRPDLSSGDALKRFLLSAKSIVISAGPSGIYLNGLFRKWGIAEAIKGKTRQLAPGENPGEVLARGAGDIGFTQVSELLPLNGIDYLGPLPADIQNATIFSAGLGLMAQNSNGARALVKFLTAPDAATVLTKTGLKPQSR